MTNSDEQAFEHLNSFIKRLENLESIELKGMGIVEHIGELVQAINRPKLHTLKLPLNGIEAEYCLYFTHMLPFETLVHLDLSNNWFGDAGLSRFKHSFKNFKCLKVLNISNNKLCPVEPGLGDVREFRDTLEAVAHSLEELSICENRIGDPEMVDFLMEPIARMANLRNLNISRNLVSGIGIVGLLERIITVQMESTSMPPKLQKLNVTGCWLKDQGLAELLPKVASEFTSMDSLIVSANRLTENS